MIKMFSDKAWEEYTWWEENDTRGLRRVKTLMKDIDRNGYQGIGEPEPLKGDFSGYWSRRIDKKNRLIYRIVDNKVEYIQCRGHYKDN